MQKKGCWSRSTASTPFEKWILVAKFWTKSKKPTWDSRKFKTLVQAVDSLFFFLEGLTSLNLKYISFRKKKNENSATKISFSGSPYSSLLPKCLARYPPTRKSGDSSKRWFVGLGISEPSTAVIPITAPIILSISRVQVQTLEFFFCQIFVAKKILSMPIFTQATNMSIIKSRCSSLRYKSRCQTWRFQVHSEVVESVPSKMKWWYSTHHVISWHDSVLQHTICEWDIHTCDRSQYFV